MRNDKIRRFKPRMNKFRSRRPSNGMKNNGVIHQNNIHRNGLSRNHVNKNPHNLERIIEKYKNLAKDAMSSGDYIGAENYLQHAEHYARIINIKNERNINGNSSDNKKKLEIKNSEIDDPSEQDQPIEKESASLEA